MHRQILLVLPLLITALVGCESGHDVAAPAAVPAGIVVAGGTVSGVQVMDSPVTAFKGIPYAAPPLGDLRWKPPQAVVPWEGVLSAVNEPDACVQDLGRSRAPWTEEYMHQGDASEDCLYLNLWTAAAGTSERRPVMVWIYGGGLREGSISIATYDGAALARKGVVLVSVNYRLGPIGFLAHPGLTAESQHGASGNYGFLDQVAALQWVQANISSFGGDPDNVTIFGQSAGARSVAMLMRSPLAKGLFHHAIIQSGAQRRGETGNADLMSLAEAEQLGLEAQARVGANSLAELRATPAERFLEADIGGRGAIADGWFWPAHSPSTSEVPVLVGFTADDGFVGPEDDNLTVETYAAEAGELYGDNATAYLSLYPVATASEARAVKLAALRDKAKASVSLWAEGQLARSEHVYTYFFDRATPWPEHPEFGAHHTSDVPYVFGTLEVLADRRPEDTDYLVSDMLSSYWVNFAANGDPNGAGQPEWAEFDAAAESIMRLAGDAGPVGIAEPAKLQFWRKVLAPAD